MSGTNTDQVPETEAAPEAQAEEEEKAPRAGEIEVWNVVSAGPSRFDLEKEDFLEGAPVVAVNNALDIRDSHHVDIWAFWDHPDKVASVDRKYIRPPLTCWMGADRFAEMTAAGFGRSKHPDWELEFHPLIGFRALDKGLVTDPIKGGQRSAFSLIYVLEKCARLGAKRIRVLSCDLSGPWHAGATTEEASRAINRWDRWAYEKAQLLGLEHRDDPKKSYPGLVAWFRTERGVEIELYKKKPAPVTAA